MEFQEFSIDATVFLRLANFKVISERGLDVHFTNDGDLVNGKDVCILKGNMGSQTTS